MIVTEALGVAGLEGDCATGGAADGGGVGSDTTGMGGSDAVGGEGAC